MSAENRSIRTRYKDILFRSKLEADWARAFDALGIRWEYEDEGRYFGDVFYLVDFWLPASRQFVEVKGVFEPNDVRKVAALLSNVEARPFTDPDECPDVALVACEPNGVFRGWVRGVVDRHANLLELSQKASRELRLFACAICAGWWFADDSLSWRCQCCGATSGNGHILSDIGSPLPGFPALDDIRPLGARD
jgi:hypothetical protein